MSDISEARQALRDYAREEVVERRVLTGNFDHMPYEFVVGARGATAGKVFEAVQAALTVAEELHAEADKGPNPEYIGIQVGLEDVERRTKHEAADRIEAAILKALG